MQTGTDITQVKMSGADGTREVKQNSILRETAFQSKTGSKTGDKKQGPLRKIPKNTKTKPHPESSTLLYCLLSFLVSSSSSDVHCCSVSDIFLSLCVPYDCKEQT